MSLKELREWYRVQQARAKLPSISPTKDTRGHPIFLSFVVRWTWRTYTQRLTLASRWFIPPTILLGSIGSLAFDAQNYIPFCYAAAMWVVAFFCMLLFKPRVRLIAHHGDRVCAGENLPVDIEVEQVGQWGGADQYILAHRLPQAVDAVPEGGVPLPPLAPGDRTRIRMALSCPRRGLYTLHGFRAATDFPFGMLVALRNFEEDRSLLVYPRFTRLTRLQIPPGRRYHPGGVALVSNLGDSFEFIGNRDYREGDNIRDIDWRATARLSKLIVREYREEYFLRVAVILDTHVPRGSRPEARDAFESAVSVAAAVSDYMARQEYIVDLFAAGPNLYHLTAGRSLAYLDQILDILACVEENPLEPFQVIEPELLESLGQITTVICVFLDWTESRQALVRRLSQGGTSIKVILVRDTPPTLDPSAESEILGETPILSTALVNAGLEEI